MVRWYLNIFRGDVAECVVLVLSPWLHYVLPLYTTEGHGSSQKVTKLTAHANVLSVTHSHYWSTDSPWLSCQQTGWTSRLTFYSLKFYWSPNKTKSLLSKTKQSSSKRVCKVYCPTGGLCDVSSYVSCVEQFLMPPPTTSTGPHSRVHPRLAWKSSEQSFCLIFPSAGIMGWDFRNTVPCSSLFSFSKVSEQHSPPGSVFSLREQGLLHFHFSFLGILEFTAEWKNRQAILL